MRKVLTGLVLALTLGFGLGQLTNVRAGTVTLSCGAYLEEWGQSYKSPNAVGATVNYFGVCYNYYLNSTIVNNGSTLTWPSGGWSSSPLYFFPASGTTSIFSNHNTWRSWYNGYVGSSDY